MTNQSRVDEPVASGGYPTPPLDLAGLREAAEKAIVGDPLDRPDFPGEWEAWFNFHGDPYVVEKDRGQWSIVATISSAPEDYGKARAEFIGAADPTTVLALLDEIERLRKYQTAITDAIVDGRLKGTGPDA